MPPSLEQDAWFVSTFGVNPATFNAASANGTSADAGRPAGDANGKVAAEGSVDWARKRPSFGKAAKVWSQTVAETAKDLQRIRREIVDTFDGEPEGLELEKDFVEELEGCLKSLDLTLHDELMQLAGQPDDPQGKDPFAEARRLVEGHIAYLKTDPFMKAVDSNPFEIVIVDRLTASLAAIEHVLATDH